MTRQTYLAPLGRSQPNVRAPLRRRIMRHELLEVKQIFDGAAVAAYCIGQAQFDWLWFCVTKEISWCLVVT